MDFLTEIAKELKQEAVITRRYLERVDFAQADFKPHEKSENLGRLAVHVAEIVAWWKNVLEEKELNFLGFEPKTIESSAELLAYFDELLAGALAALRNASADELKKLWSMTEGDETLFTLNKKEVLRKFCMNHLVHHRGQLSLYLRLTGCDVPATYGPSADDWDITLIESYG